jgi:hypothetical protein
MRRYVQYGLAGAGGGPKLREWQNESSMTIVLNVAFQEFQRIIEPARAALRAGCTNEEFIAHRERLVQEYATAHPESAPTAEGSRE